MAKAARTAGATPAVTQLTASGVAFREHSYSHSSGAESYGMEAASALGVDPARVFKTLLLSASERLVVAIVPVDRRVDLKTAAAAFDAKRAVLADPKAAQQSTGYVVGGISPFGQRRPLPTALDRSALDHETVFVSGGRRGFDLEVSPTDLVDVLHARIADLSR